RLAGQPQLGLAGLARPPAPDDQRSEEHTSELQSRENLVCRLLLEKKKQNKPDPRTSRPHRPCRFSRHQRPARFRHHGSRLLPQFFFFLMIRRPPKSTLFPYRRFSD